MPHLGDTLVLMVLQAYIDDSVSDATDGDWFVLAGHIASTEQWAKFALEWERLLPWAGANPLTNVRRFKLNEMRPANSIDMERVAAFYRVIEDNVMCALSVRMRPTWATERLLSRPSVSDPSSPTAGEFGRQALNVQLTRGGRG